MSRPERTQNLMCSFVLSAGVVFEVVGDECVIIDTQTAEVYTLNSTGSIIWNLLSEGRTASIEGLTSMGFSRSSAERYISEFVADLVSAGIIRCSSI